MKIVYVVMGFIEHWDWDGEDSVRSVEEFPAMVFENEADAKAYATRHVFPHDQCNDRIYHVNCYEPGEKP